MINAEVRKQLNRKGLEQALAYSLPLVLFIAVTQLFYSFGIDRET